MGIKWRSSLRVRNSQSAKKNVRKANDVRVQRPHAEKAVEKAVVAPVTLSIWTDSLRTVQGVLITASEHGGVALRKKYA